MDTLIMLLAVLALILACVNIGLQISLVRMVLKDCDEQERAHLLALLAESAIVSRWLLRLWRK